MAERVSWETLRRLSALESVLRLYATNLSRNLYQSRLP